MEVTKRKNIAAVALLLIIDRERKKCKKKNKRIWARKWLQRRQRGQNILTMLHNELRFVKTYTQVV